jgi:ABC-type multidrug transport system fused ATPase/permease subunit
MNELLQACRKVLPYLRPYWRLLTASVVVTLVGAGVELLSPWPMKIIVDSVIGNVPLPRAVRWAAQVLHGKGPLLLLTVVTGLAISILIKSLGVLTEYLDTRLNLAVTLDVQSDVFQQAQRLSVAYNDTAKSGDLLYAINLSSSTIGLVMMLAPLAHNILMLVGMFWISFSINPTLALLSLTVVPFLYLSGGYYTKRIRGRLSAVQSSEASLLELVHEAIGMMRVIVAFGREDHEFARFRREGERAMQARVQITLQQSLFSLAVETTTAVGTAAVLGYGSYLVLHGRLSTGDLLIVLAYIASVFGPLQAISGTVGHLQQQLASLRRVFSLLDARPDVQDAPDASPIRQCHGHVSFDAVSFNYPGREGTLKGISFDAAPGEAIAVVGATGAGKSTLISLLPRFYDPVEGRILLDGVDVRMRTLRSLRAQISMVLQEPLLFSGSIADNIRYGRLDATMDDIITAAREANAHDFISALPKGYDTVVGERGARLSGGERQRVSVARAFLKNAPILILDEPTSSIDSRTEATILDALERLMVGRTTFVVAHRLSTLRSVNTILVMDHGEIVERGTHDQLLAVGGVYARLHAAQRAGAGRPAPDPEDALVTDTHDA